VSLHANLELGKLSFKIVPAFGLPNVFSSFGSSAASCKNLLYVG
jgi:hypothetical protein